MQKHAESFWNYTKKQCLDPTRADFDEKFEGDYKDSDMIAEPRNVASVSKNGGDNISKYGVRSIPAVFVEKDGEVVDKFSGAKSEQDLRSFFDSLN